MTASSVPILASTGSALLSNRVLTIALILEAELLFVRLTHALQAPISRAGLPVAQAAALAGANHEFLVIAELLGALVGMISTFAVTDSTAKDQLVSLALFPVCDAPGVGARHRRRWAPDAGPRPPRASCSPLAPTSDASVRGASPPGYCSSWATSLAFFSIRQSRSVISVGSPPRSASGLSWPRWSGSRSSTPGSERRSSAPSAPTVLGPERSLPWRSSCSRTPATVERAVRRLAASPRPAQRGRPDDRRAARRSERRGRRVVRPAAPPVPVRHGAGDDEHRTFRPGHGAPRPPDRPTLGDPAGPHRHRPTRPDGGEGPRRPPVRAASLRGVRPRGRGPHQGGPRASIRQLGRRPD